MTTATERNAVLALRHRLERVAGQLVEGDDSQLERLVRLVDELGAARRLVQRARFEALCEALASSPDVARGFAHRIGGGR